MEFSTTTLEVEQRDLDVVARSRSGSDIVVLCGQQPNEDRTVGSASTETATTVATSTTSVAPTYPQMLMQEEEEEEQVVFRRAREDKDHTPQPLPPTRLPPAAAAALPLPPYATLSAAAADIDDATIDALAVVDIGSNYDDDAVSMLAVADDPEDERRRQNERRRRRQKHDEYDVLTIFQAAPLVYKNKWTGELQCLDVLNYDSERDELENAIKETTAALPCEDDESSMMTSASSSTRRKVLHVDFQIATVDRLGLFLAEEKGETMHFSCHGNPR